jgi:hypothetical protein
MGGLGNQLFQIFTTMSYGFTYNHEIKFEYSDFLNERKTYWNNLFKTLGKYLVPSISGSNIKIMREKSFEYVLLPYSIDNIMLFGYFQSPNYFQNHYPYLRNLLEISQSQNSIRSKYNKIIWEKTISIHFRWGDYVEKSDFHPILTFSYYVDAIKYILHRDSTITTILFFCEDENLNEIMSLRIEPLKQKFSFLNFEQGGINEEDWYQLLMMSCCKHNIIANSSFSWWGAYFNETLEKIVCYPKTWFGPFLSYNNTRDLFPTEWAVI